VKEDAMNYDKDKVDEMVLALLYLTSTHDQYATRAWKGLDLETLDRLCQKGYISDPKAKSPTLVLTDAGAKLSKELFLKYFEAKE
jgi:hypothetical protein